MKRNLLLLCIGIVFVGTGFLAGYFAGSYFFEGQMPEPTPVATADTMTAQAENANEALSQQVDITPEPTYAGVRYLVVLEEESLHLYEVEGDRKKQLRKNEIETQLYPESDIRELEDGIYAGTLEGALEILENFAG